MSKIKLGQNGSVYILLNEATPGIIKVGATTDDPLVRAKQLSASTSVVVPFVVAYSRQVSDVNEVERLMHQYLDEYRVNQGREYFRVSLYKAVNTLDLIVGGNKASWEPLTPFAELFASFDDDGTARELTPEEQKKCRVLEAKVLQN